MDRADVLLRVVLDRPAPGDDVLHVSAVSVVADPGRRLPGRGAWIHRDQRCLQAAERRRTFGRALRVPGGARKSGGDIPVDLERLRQYLVSDLTGPSDDRAGGPIVSTQ